ncbi:MAG: tetratricopeptide repeat protein [Candidatus Xenobiia bacterium LiM19]
MKFTRIAGCNVSDQYLGIIHDYGEIAFPWDDITHVFALKLKNMDGDEFPILLLVIRYQESYFYIDGSKISPRLFTFENSSSDGQFSGGYVMPKTMDLLERKFKWVAGEISSHLTHAYQDKPLLECLKSSIFFLPTFANFKDASEYFVEIVENASIEESSSVEELASSQEDLKQLSTPATEREEWKEGTVLEGRYTVQQVLKGGMGTVYVIFDSVQVKFQAFKTFQERYLWNDRAIKQFIKEAEIWIKLERHPNVVNAERIEVIEGKPYIVLEYIQGTDLESILKAEMLPVKKSIEYAIQFCEGMSYAFKKLGLIHRDIKPTNCFITREGVVKISDFGLGKIFDEAPPEAEALSLSQLITEKKMLDKKFSSTSSTGMVGTLPFMAPELFININATSTKTDIYSFGLVFYIMLTGINPFFSEDPYELIQNHLSVQPKPPQSYNSEVPESLSVIVLRCLEKEPEKRYDDFAQLKKAIEEAYSECFHTRYQYQEPQDIFSEEDWLNKGISLASLSRHKEAVITFDQALKINPQSIEGKIQKGTSLIKLNRTEEAIECFDEVLQLDLGNWKAWFFKGEALRKMGKREEALTCINRALDRDPDRPEALRSKGNLLAETGKELGSLIYFNRALELKPKFGEIWSDKGIVLLKLRRYNEASTCFLKAIEINPRSYLAWSHRGEVLFRLGFYSEAINAFQTALSLKPNSIRELVGTAHAYQELGDYQNALNTIDQALKIKHDSLEMLLVKARILEENGKIEEAERCLREIAGLHPSEHRILFHLARVNFRMKRFEKTIRYCSELMERGEKNWESSILMESATRWQSEKENLLNAIRAFPPLAIEPIYRSLNSLLSVFCSVDDAITHLEYITVKRRETSLFILLSKLRKARGDFKGAAQAAENAVASDPSSEDARNLFNQAISDLESSKERQKAKAGFLAALLKRETQSDLTAEEWMLKGLESILGNRPGESIRQFQEALKMDSGYDTCWFFAGLAFKELNDIDNADNCFETFSRKFPHSPGFYKFKILNAPAATDHATLEEYYHRWIGYFPSDHLSWISYLRYLTEIRETEKVFLISTEIADVYSLKFHIPKRSSIYWSLRGTLELTLGRYFRAARYFKKSLSYEPTNELARIGTGASYELSGNIDEALTYYQSIEQIETSTIMSLYQSARILAMQKKQKEALKSIDAAIKCRPSSFILNYKKAQIFLQCEDHRGFFSFYNTIYHLDAHYHAFYTLRARALLDTGAIKEAHAYLTSAAAVFSDDIDVCKTLAALDIRLGFPEKALDLYDRIISMNPLNADGYLGKGVMLYVMKRYDDSAAHLGAYMTLCPFDPYIYLYLGAVTCEIGDHNKAEMYFRKAVNVQSHFACAWANLGIFYFRTGKPDESIQYAERALRINNTNVHAWLCRGRAQKAQGNRDEALKSIEQALYYSPQELYGWFQKGILHYELKDYKQSLECFSKACEIDDRQSGIWYNRGLVAFLSSEHNEAQKALSRSVVLDPGNFAAWQAKALLHRLQDDDFQFDKAVNNLESIDNELYKQWHSSIASEMYPEEKLPINDGICLPFDLPIAPGIECKEPFQPIHFQTLDGNF